MPFRSARWIAPRIRAWVCGYSRRVRDQEAIRTVGDEFRGSSGFRVRVVAAWLVLLLGGTACEPRPADPRPSILLVVLDTVRRDAVSSLGPVEGTTPTLDRLAAEGQSYLDARSTSSWTLPSHASLFTGLRFDQHGVGTSGHMGLPEELTTLAERLAEAGYRTAAFSENMLVSPAFEMFQGFQYSRSVRFLMEEREHAAPAAVKVQVDLVSDIGHWLAGRVGAGPSARQSGPLFVFVNVYDAHSPFEIRDTNPWVPESATPAEIERRAYEPEKSLCDDLPFEEQIAIQRGLYLGDVHAADAKLAGILAAIEAADPGRRWITIVTSDHGELLGEHQLFGHEFSLAEETLRIPLVVHGAPGAPPARIETPVSILDVLPSVLAWTGTAAPTGLPGRALPRANGDAPPRDFFAGYTDDYVADAKGREFEGIVGFASKDEARIGCRRDRPVFGPMATLIRPPLKLHWYRDYPARLYDLSWDPGERSDLSLVQPADLVRLMQDIAPLLESARFTGSGADAPPAPAPSAERIEALRALGYIDE